MHELKIRFMTKCNHFNRLGAMKLSLFVAILLLTINATINMIMWDTNNWQFERQPMLRLFAPYLLLLFGSIANTDGIVNLPKNFTNCIDNAFQMAYTHGKQHHPNILDANSYTCYLPNSVRLTFVKYLSAGGVGRTFLATIVTTNTGTSARDSVTNDNYNNRYVIKQSKDYQCEQLFIEYKNSKMFSDKLAADNSVGISYNINIPRIHPKIPFYCYYNDISKSKTCFMAQQFIDNSIPLSKFMDISYINNLKYVENREILIKKCYNDIITVHKWLQTQFSIFHDDMSVNNVLYDLQSKKCYLIDFDNMFKLHAHDDFIHKYIYTTTNRLSCKSYRCSLKRFYQKKHPIINQFTKKIATNQYQQSVEHEIIYHTNAVFFHAFVNFVLFDKIENKTITDMNVMKTMDAGFFDDAYDYQTSGNNKKLKLVNALKAIRKLNSEVINVRPYMFDRNTITNTKTGEEETALVRKNFDARAKYRRNNLVLHSFCKRYHIFKILHSIKSLVVEKQNFVDISKDHITNKGMFLWNLMIQLENETIDVSQVIDITNCDQNSDYYVLPEYSQ